MKIVAVPGEDRLRRRFLLLGAVLFLLGLLSGLVPGMMENPRMGLSAHMQGITNGTFLLAVGAIWGWVRLTPLAQRIVFWMFAFGTLANWLATQLAAYWGTGRMTPIMARGFAGTDWQERVVSDALIAVTITMLIGAVLLVIGLAQKGEGKGES